MKESRRKAETRGRTKEKGRREGDRKEEESGVKGG